MMFCLCSYGFIKTESYDFTVDDQVRYLWHRKKMVGLLGRMKKRRRMIDIRRKVLDQVVGRWDIEQAMYHEVFHSEELGFILHDTVMDEFSRNLTLIMNAVAFSTVVFGLMLNDEAVRG